ncbi:MAG: DUF2892 domain-containing protein [Thermaurantimonas sp.]
MKSNIGKTDKGIRLTLAAPLIVLYFTNILSGTLGVIGLVVAGMLTLTSLINFCPAYTLFGINTCKFK